MQQTLLLQKSELRYVKSWTHGGVAVKSRRKIKRPLIPNKVIHVVFKSSKAKGSLSFLTHKLTVKALLDQRAQKHFVKVLDFVNMGNHLHLKVKFKDLKRFQDFLRTFAALLSRKITGANRNQRFGQFWDGIVYTRVLHSSFEELGLKGYFKANHIQRELGYQARESHLAQFNKYLRSLKTVKAKPKEESLSLLSMLGP